MKKQMITAGMAALLTLLSQAHSADDFATGNMHFDAKSIDTNHDGMISRKEFMDYGEAQWKNMSHGRKTVPVNDAATAFATGNMNMNVESMDADHDGSISKDEFMKYIGAQFDKMKDKKGMMTVDDAATNFARGKPSE